MIQTRKNLKEYLIIEQPFYWKDDSLINRILDILTAIPAHSIQCYTKLLRKTEYYNNKTNVLTANRYMLIRRKKNKLGQKLGIFENTFSKGLKIFDGGSIVINGNAIVGKNCHSHGSQLYKK